MNTYDFKSNAVTIAARTAKKHKQTILPLRESTAVALQNFFSVRLPEAKAFIVPDKTAKMLMTDLEAASINYQADDGSFKDFHGFRHLTATIVNAGVKVHRLSGRNKTVAPH